MDARLLPLLAALIAGCGVSRYPDPGRPNYTSFTWHQTRVTAGGNVLDDSENQVTDRAVDGTIKNALDCWASVAPLSPQEEEEAYCDGKPLYGYAGSMSVYVVTNWHISACSGKQLFPCNVPDASCEAKGLTPTAQCPCECRGEVQDDSFIATAPNLEIVPWRVIELVSGCEHIEKVPRMAQCGAISLVADP